MPRVMAGQGSPFPVGQPNRNPIETGSDARIEAMRQLAAAVRHARQYVLPMLGRPAVLSGVVDANDIVEEWLELVASEVREATPAAVEADPTCVRFRELADGELFYYVNLNHLDTRNGVRPTTQHTSSPEPGEQAVYMKACVYYMRENSDDEDDLDDDRNNCAYIFYGADTGAPTSTPEAPMSYIDETNHCDEDQWVRRAEPQLYPRVARALGRLTTWNNRVTLRQTTALAVMQTALMREHASRVASETSHSSGEGFAHQALQEGPTDAWVRAQRDFNHS